MVQTNHTLETENSIFSYSEQFDILPDDEESTDASCHLPTGVPALCVPLRRCTHITALAANLQKPIPPNVALIIKDSYFCNNSGEEESSVARKKCKEPSFVLIDKIQYQ